MVVKWFIVFACCEHKDNAIDCLRRMLFVDRWSIILQTVKLNTDDIKPLNYAEADRSNPGGAVAGSAGSSSGTRYRCLAAFLEACPPREAISCCRGLVPARYLNTNY